MAAQREVAFHHPRRPHLGGVGRPGWRRPTLAYRAACARFDRRSWAQIRVDASAWLLLSLGSRITLFGSTVADVLRLSSTVVSRCQIRIVATPPAGMLPPEQEMTLPLW